MNGAAEPVVVGSAPDGVIGAIMAAAIESAGIPVAIRSVGAGWLYPGAPTNAGPVELLVPVECVADARTILAAEEGGA